MPVVLRLPFAAVAAAASLLLLAGSVSAQIPEPPSTFYGSVTDAAGPVPADVPIVAIVNNNICGETETVHVGEGSSRVTMYVIDVLSERQTPGCGKPGDAVRLRVGDRLAEQAVPWAGTGELILFNIVFGNATPAVIPTATQTPTPPPTTAASTPGAGGTPANEATLSASATAGANRTEPGGVTSETPGPGASGDDSSGGGFPVWALLLLGVGGIAAVGGGIGYMMSRGNAGGASSEPPADGV